MGASGSSLFPHLHYELRDGPGAREVKGLPSYFSNFRRILGARSVTVKKRAVNTGDLVDWQSPAGLESSSLQQLGPKAKTSEETDDLPPGMTTAEGAAWLA